MKTYNVVAGGKRRAQKTPLQQARAKEAGRLLRLQLKAKGVDITDIADIMGLRAKTTLTNHIRSGQVTLLELCEIADYWTIDVNAILREMRDERASEAAEAKARTKMESAKPAPKRTPSAPVLTEDDLQLAEELGLDSWGD